ncbi:MAG: hypothetical protein WCF18_00040 [Chthoniobacteraceae bacterium]
MKFPIRSLALTVLLAATISASAQERIDSQEAQRIARKLTDTVGNPSDAPFTTEVDPDKPNGFKGSGVGLMALPDRKLTADALEHAGKDIVPLGQLWTMGASVATNGKAVASDQLRLVKVGDEGKQRELQLYYLGAGKSDSGELQLIIFAKDKAQPVLRVPLKKSGSSSFSSPIELEGRKQDDESGILTVRVLGDYSAEVTVMKQE